MCGIGGILRVHPPGSQPPPPEIAIPESWLDLIDDSIKHRGPDGKGRFRDRALRPDGSTVDVAFVHRRLSIIDHAGGHQPMVQGGIALLSGDEGDYRRTPCHICPRCAELAGKATQRAPSASEGVLRPTESSAASGPGNSLLAVVFNGCIYNHRDLRKELQTAGHVFASDHSDTEVLLHGWREWNSGLMPRLDGMFAGAFWDCSTGAVVTIRDPFGEKPLYTLKPAGSMDFGVWAFASSAAALARTRPAINVVPERAGLADPFLRGWVKFGWNQLTPFNDIQDSLIGFSSPLGDQQARVAIANAGAGESGNGSGSWWGDVLQDRTATLDVEATDAALRAAVHSRLEADVPLGCFLSGGVDSPLVARYASEVCPDLTALTVRMPDRAFDESEAAAALARHAGIRHEILDCDAHPAEDLAAGIEELGLPFGDSSLLPSLWVSRAARQRVKVALAGDGGDELFLGYDRHALLRWLPTLGRIPRPLFRAAGSVLTQGPEPRSMRTRASRLLNAMAGSNYKELVAIFPPPFDRALGLDSLQHFGLTTMRGAFAITTALRFDLLFYLPNDLLRKTDTASMHHALEVRAPFLARGVAQRAINTTLASLMPHHQRKGLLRAVARKYFPKEIVDRPKQGFAIPIGEWFRSDYGGLKTLLLDHLNSTEPWGSPSLGIDLNMKFVRQMLDEHLGTGPSGLVKRDHSQRLYMLLVLSIWAKWLSRL